SAANAFSDAQRAEIESIIKDYLVDKNPDVMAEGLRKLDQRRRDAAEAKTKEKLVSEKDRIFNDPATPVGGNPKGKVSVVEFFDYGCGYCKMGEESVEALLNNDKDVRFIYKNYPVLGEVSHEAAKAGLASVKQGKFQTFHRALMMKKERLSNDVIYKVAGEVGLDVAKLKKDMADPSIENAIKASIQLGQDIGAEGTPFFIINDTSYSGVLQTDQLKYHVDEARKKASKP
ncbi:MAG: DsbA family protein, partial [Bdellovibrionales bacterium]